jgi:DNA-binding NtrC family response regulator
MSDQTNRTQQLLNSSVVVVDDEEGMCTILKKVLSQEGALVETFTQPRLALEFIEKHGADVVVTDLKMPELSGMDILRRVRQLIPATNVVLITAHATVDNAIEAIREGAYDYLTKPFKLDELVFTVARAAERKRLEEKNEARTLEPTELVGNSPQIREVRTLIAKVAPTDAPVLLRGESGTGKELAARALHRQSPRAGKPFVAINCASIPESLLESELFGYEKGAFTGAERTKMGLVEVAHGGTLFLDEIGDLPLTLQAKVLRMLQEHEIQRVGGLQPIHVDVRLIAATNRDLEEAMRNRSFRSDLYYRLNVISIELPPLREREGDLPILLEYLAAKIAKKLQRDIPVFSSEAVQALQRYPFPGNVRELENLVERLLILCDKPEITFDDLPADVREAGAPSRKTPSSLTFDVSQLDYRAARDAFEEMYFRQLLEVTRGNVSEAARISGISRRHIYEKFERYGIQPRQTQGSDSQ